MIDIEDFKKSIGKKSRLLGIDPGKNRVGLAISDEDKLVSTPLKTIVKKKNIVFSLRSKFIISILDKKFAFQLTCPFLTFFEVF